MRIERSSFNYLWLHTVRLLLKHVHYYLKHYQETPRRRLYSRFIGSLLCSKPNLCSTWWCHQIETFFALLPFVREVHRPPVNYPHKGQWRGALIFHLICVCINGWVHNREAGDLRRHRAHYDVILMNMHCVCCENMLYWAEFNEPNSNQSHIDFCVFHREKYSYG